MTKLSVTLILCHNVHITLILPNMKTAPKFNKLLQVAQRLVILVNQLLIIAMINYMVPLVIV